MTRADWLTRSEFIALPTPPSPPGSPLCPGVPGSMPGLYGNGRGRGLPTLLQFVHRITVAPWGVGRRELGQHFRRDESDLC